MRLSRHAAIGPLLLAAAAGVSTADVHDARAASPPRAEATTAAPSPDVAEEERAAAYKAWFGGGRFRPQPLRLVLEELGVLVLGTSYYWSDPLANKEDWDDPPLIDKLRLGAASFDTNLNTTNHLLHTGAGAAAYGLARDNGLSVPASFALTAASSALWELSLEWREKVSYNDLVYTTWGGVVAGNFFQRLGDYVNSAPSSGSFGRAVASYTIGLPRRVHAALDDDALPKPLPLDDLGLSTAYSHRFRVGYELASLSNDAGDHGLMHRGLIHGELVAMPGFLRPGAFDQRFSEANFTSLSALVGFGSEAGDDEGDVEGQTTFAGEYSQSFRAVPGGGVRGQSLMFGFGSGWRFQSSEWLGRRDQLSAVHLLGPHLSTWLAAGALTARIDASAHGDFASLRSLAYDVYPEPEDRTRLKSVLIRQGYTYDLGWSAKLRAELALGPASLHGQIAYGRYGSIEGLDRDQDRIAIETHGTEEVLESAASLRIRLARIVEVGVGAAERRRASTLGPYSLSRWDRALSASAGLVF